MSKVIDPSEILVGEEGTVRSDTSKINPWIRFIARMFDYSLFFLLLFGLQKWSPRFFSLSALDSWVPLEYLLFVPIEAALLCLCGKTPGKWLLKIELRQGRRRRLGFESAITRSFQVWLRGVGMGIPFINALCLLIAYQRLKVLKTTSWDRDNHTQISHRPVSKARLVFAAVIAVLGHLTRF